MNQERAYPLLDHAALARIKNLSLLARGVVEGFITGLHGSPYKGFSSEFAEHRKYNRGDNPRHLDWRILGRTDRLYVKQYEEETNLRAHILLDASGSMSFASGRAGSKFEYAQRLAAVLAYFLIRQQDAVGLVGFDARIRLEMPARGSPLHFDAMMKRLESLRPGRGTDLGAILHRLADRFQKRCLIILISDLLDDPDTIDKALHHFRGRRHELILFHVLDHAELEFPYQDSAEFVDLESGERIQVDPSHVRQDYQERFQDFLTRCRRICADCQFDYVLADSSAPLDQMLARYLEKRSRK